MNILLEIAGILVSIGSAVTIVWKLMLPKIKETIQDELSGTTGRLTEIEKKQDAHMSLTEDLLGRDFENIKKLQDRQTIIRKGLMALVDSVLESEVMNNKAEIANAKKDLINDLLEH
jgi:hypothetical protein